MILDLRELADGSLLQADLCIVGAGPAGITLARRFAAGAREVLLLESGGLEVEAEAQELNRGEVRGERYYDLRLPRQRAFGGTSVHWTGEMGAFGADDFAPRPWLEMPGWPIELEELTTRYLEALEICGGSPWPRDSAREPAGFRRDPMPPGGASWLELRYRQRSAAGPLRFGRHYRSELAASRSLRVLLHASVTELLADPRGDHVHELTVRTIEGRRATVSARAFVLACGGLENPRLLLLSNRDDPEGLGNRHHQVGRCFQEHPIVDLGEVFGFRSRLSPLAGFVPGSPVLLRDLGPAAEFAARERLLQFGIEISGRGERAWNLNHRRPDGNRRLNADAARLLPWLTDELRTSPAEGPELPNMQRAKLEVMQEMEPDPASRVTLGDERDVLGSRRLVLDLRLGEDLRRTLAAAARGLVRELGRFSIGRVAPAPWTAPELGGGEIQWRGAAHHVGTTRMAENPAHGVVDRDCRVHGIDNLWIAGSSVFPLGGYVNPTLTIVALALRLADHLEEKLK